MVVVAQTLTVVQATLPVLTFRYDLVHMKPLPHAPFVRQMLTAPKTATTLTIINLLPNLINSFVLESLDWVFAICEG